jgi:hypothetical protein
MTAPALLEEEKSKQSKNMCEKRVEIEVIYPKVKNYTHRKAVLKH